MIKLTKHISIINTIKSLFLFSIIVLLISCNRDRTIGPHKCYLHLSHTRTNSNLFMNNLLEIIDFNRFDMLWLGGDLALSTSSNNMTMDRINNMFNIEDRNTLWSLGIMIIQILKELRIILKDLLIMILIKTELHL